MFGLQRSGTNYLEQLLKLNFGIQKANRNKHSVIVPNNYTDSNLPTFVIYKNIYTWLESICMRNRVDWLKIQLMYPADEPISSDLKLGGLNIINIAKTYYTFLKNWEKEPVYFIKYEDLLFKDSREKILNDIEKKFNLRRKNNKWLNVDYGKVSQSPNYNSQIENYYKNMQPKYLNEFQINKIKQIKQNIYK